MNPIHGRLGLLQTVGEQAARGLENEKFLCMSYISIYVWKSHEKCVNYEGVGMQSVKEKKKEEEGEQR